MSSKCHWELVWPNKIWPTRSKPPCSTLPTTESLFPSRPATTPTRPALWAPISRLIFPRRTCRRTIQPLPIPVPQRPRWPSPPRRVRLVLILKWTASPRGDRWRTIRLSRTSQRPVIGWPPRPLTRKPIPKHTRLSPVLPWLARTMPVRPY